MKFSEVSTILLFLSLRAVIGDSMGKSNTIDVFSSLSPDAFNQIQVAILLTLGLR